MSAVLRRVESLATELHGKAAAVSVDKEDGWTFVRVWDAGGILAEEIQHTGGKHAALVAARSTLAHKLEMSR